MLLSIYFIVHLLIWLLIIFGGIFSSHLAKINLLVLIPGIYLIQTLPFHLFIKAKLDYIYKQMLEEGMVKVDEKNQEVSGTQLDKGDIRSRELSAEILKMELRGMNEDVLKEMVDRYKSSEDMLVIPKYFNEVRNMCDNCFQNPCSVQGIMVLGMAINAWIYFYHTGH